MPVPTWLRSLFGRARTSPIRNTPRRPRSRPQLGVVALEDRVTPATFTVTTWLDVTNAGDGFTSLREAVDSANANSGADTIDFNFDFGANNTITLTDGELLVTEALTVAGPGKDVLAVSGNDASRVFDIQNYSATDLSFTLKDITVEHGKATDSSTNGASGGAIYFRSDYYSAAGGTLRLENARVRDSRAESSSSSSVYGGGVYYYSYYSTALGGLEVVDSEIEGNTATGGYYVQGGGLYAAAYGYTNNVAVTFTGSTISGNTASASDVANYYYNTQARGGGMWVETNGGISLTGTTISDNTASADSTGSNSNGYAQSYAEAGGAYLYAYGTGGVSLVNSFVTGNTAVARSTGAISNYQTYANAFAGGLRVYAQNDGLTVTGTTIRGNTADAASTNSNGNTYTQADAQVGGLYSGGSGTTFTDSLIADNEAVSKATDLTGSGYQTNAGADTGGLYLYSSSYYSNNAGITLTRTVVSGNSSSAEATGSASYNYAYANVGGMRAYNDSYYGTGGGITVTDSTVSGNSADAVATAAPGTNGSADTSVETGGMMLQSYDGYYSSTGTTVVSVTGSTVSGNTATSSSTASGTGYANSRTYAGGAYLIHQDYYSNGSSSNLEVTNSTFSGNTSSASSTADTGTAYANAYAGGVRVYNYDYYSSSDTGSIRATTITDNVVSAKATGGSTSSQATGGGLYNDYYYNNPIEVGSTIVAGNRDTSGSQVADDVYGTYASLGHNLIGNGDDSSGFTGTGDQVGTTAAPIDAKLAPLANNGGLTKTHALMTGSTALNAGDDFGLTTDQRGGGFARVSGGQADIGAFEVLNSPPTDISLSNSSVLENKAAGTLVGVLGTTDPDVTDTLFTYTLVSGDTASFAIFGSQLKTATAFDYESKSSYSVTVRTTDAGGAWYEETFTISVTNVNEVTGFDVQKGQTQRSFVRYQDIAFESATGLAGIVASVGTASPRIKLTRYNLDGTTGATAVSLTGKVTVSGSTLAIDFGAQGIGGNRSTNAGDGYYVYEIDTDGDGVFETTKSFYRLFGDVSGDGKVKAVVNGTAPDDDGYRIAGRVGSPYSAEYDANGDGVVNLNDRNFALVANGRALGTGLLLDD